MRPLRLAVLLCDTPVPQIRSIAGDYTQIFVHFLSSSLASLSDHARATFTLDGYDVVHEMAYPPDDVQYDGLFITGSAASAYDDTQWINKLLAYVQRIVAENPRTKLFGICFGHQIVARALGGSCVQNNGLWEVAVTTVTLNALGKAVFGADELDLQQMHRDHVPTSPPNAHLLGSTSVTPNQGMVIFDPWSPPSPEDLNASPPRVRLTSIHVLTLQGHPEFTESIMSKLIDARASRLGETLVKDGHSRAGGIPGRHHPDGLACDGVGRVGKVIWGVLGVS